VPKLFERRAQRRWVGDRSRTSPRSSATVASRRTPTSIPTRESGSATFGWIGRCTSTRTHASIRVPLRRTEIASTRARPPRINRSIRRMFSWVRTVPITGSVRCRRSGSTRIAPVVKHTRGARSTPNDLGHNLLDRDLLGSGPRGYPRHLPIQIRFLISRRHPRIHRRPAIHACIRGRLVDQDQPADLDRRDRQQPRTTPAGTQSPAQHHYAQPTPPDSYSSSYSTPPTPTDHSNPQQLTAPIRPPKPLVA
jgi:hypothetical protein